MFTCFFQPKFIAFVRAVGYYLKLLKLFDYLILKYMLTGKHRQCYGPHQIPQYYPLIWRNSLACLMKFEDPEGKDN
jgi:hypothetical protein